MVSAVQVEVGSSFWEDREGEGLEIDFLPRCKGTTRNNMELSAHVSHLLSFRSEASEWGGKRGFLAEASGSWKRERWTEETTRAPAGWTRGQWIFWHFYPQATNWFGLIHVNSQVSHVPVSLLGSAGQPPEMTEELQRHMDQLSQKLQSTLKEVRHFRWI